MTIFCMLVLCPRTMSYCAQARKREEQRELEFRQQREEYEQRNDAQMAKMYAKLEKQMLELKTASMSAAGNKSVEAELRNQLFIAKQQLETLKAENTQMRTNLLQQPHGVGASKLNKGNSGGGGSERVLELEAYVSQLEANADKGILYQVSVYIAVWLFTKINVSFMKSTLCMCKCLSCGRWRKGALVCCPGMRLSSRN